MRIQQVLLLICVSILPNALLCIFFESSFLKISTGATLSPRFDLRLPEALPLWWCVPASTDPPSDARPAWRGGSCSGSGGQTLCPAGLEEHKGQRHKTSRTWNRIIAMDDSSSSDKSCIWQTFFKWIHKNEFLNKSIYWAGDKPREITRLIGYKNSPNC